MADTYLAYPGMPVTIKGERFQGEDDYYAPYNLKFSPGEANIINVYTSLDEVPEDTKNELFNYLGAEKYQNYIADLSLIRGAKFYFDLKRGLSDIYMVPDVDLEGTPEYKAKADLKEEVEKYLAEKQKRKEFVDLGTRASGTSKEKAAWRKVIFFTVSDLEALEKSKGLLDLIKKDRVFPKIVPDKEKDNGVSSGAAFMKTKLREYYPAKPVVDTTEGRKVFIEAANRLSEAIADVVDLADFDKNIANNQEILFDTILNAMPGVDAEELKDTLKSLSTDYKAAKAKENEVDEKYYALVKVLIEKYGDEGNPSSYNYNFKPDLLQPEELDAVNKIKQVRSAAEDDRSNYTRTSWVLANPKYSILNVLKEQMPKENFYFHEYSDTVYRCINHFFDKRFLSFFYKGDKYRDVYTAAERMGGFTQEDFDRKYQPTIDSYKKDIEGIEEGNSKLTIDKPYPEIRQSLAESSTGFPESWFPYDIYSKIPKKINGEKIKGNEGVHIFGSTILKLDPAIFPKWMDAAEKYFELWIESNIKKKKEYQKNIDKIIADNPIRETEGDDWSWAGKTPEEKEQKKKAREATTSIELTYIKRTGGYDTSMVDNAETAKEFILNIFGFGGFTGGATLKDVDARNHIRHFTGAMSDLGDILNLDIKYLNQRGNLLYALGSYAGQRSLAFFRASPGENLISFTKTRGDGTVCHEYGHYLDFLMGGFTKMLSSSFDSSYKGRYYLSRPSYYSETSVTGAMFNLMKFIVEGYGDDVQQKVNLIVPEEYKDFSTSPDLKRIFSQAAEVDVAISMLQDRYRQYKRYSSLKPRDMAIYYTILSHYGHKEYEVPFNINGTQFYAASKALDATRSKPYWGTPVELFARAFETYVFDKLEKAGRVNNYLVSGWFSEFPDNVYPSGQEREALFGYFEKLIEAFKQQYSVPDFVASWTTERTDDYTDLKDNEEVSVNADTGELVNKKTDKENIAKMLKQLARMLKKS
jgi:hypothetical protein